MSFRMQRSTLLSCLVLLSCQSSESQILGVDAESLQQLPPVPYRIALKEVDVRRVGSQQESKWYFAVQPDELRRQLIRELSLLNTATQVVSYERIEDDTDVDLILNFSLENASFAPSGINSSAPLTLILWYFTWIGGLWIDDTDYESEVTFNLELTDPWHPFDPLRSRPTRTGETILNFWDRNKPFRSLGFYEALVFPSFWTHDDSERVSETLTSRAILQIAGEIKRDLNSRLPDEIPEGRYARFQFRSPRNLSRVGRQVDLDCDIRAKQPIASVQLLINDRPVESKLIPIAPSPTDQWRDPGYFVWLALQVPGLGLSDGVNYLRLIVRFEDGEITSRTILVYSEPAESSLETAEHG